MKTTQQLRQISNQFRRGELFRIKGILFEVQSADLKRGTLHLRTVDNYKTVTKAPPYPIKTGSDSPDATDELLVIKLNGGGSDG